MVKFVQLILMAMVISLYPATALAQTPSPAMIEQFKKLPRAQQEQLAQQYGYNLPVMGSQNSSSAALQQPETLEPQASSAALDQSRRIAKEQIDGKKVKRFGLNLFNKEVSTFAPVSNVPVPDSYILGPDDTLSLQLYGKENTTYELAVNRDGNINLPEVGPLNVSGLRFAEAQQLIAERVKNAKIGVSAAVTMGQLRTINIIIAGEAKQPGAYAVSALTTVTQAIFVAGGVSDIGSLRNIQVNRSGKQVVTFDLYQLLLHGNAQNDIHLQHGDVVFIPPVKALATVKGEVQRPAIYELTKNETLQDLLKMAGGTKAGAYPSNAVLERFNDNSLRDLRNVNLTKQADQQLAARAGDVLTVAVTSPRIEKAVTVAGAVIRPGQFAWQPGMKVSDLLPSLWSGLHMVADLDYALIVRERNNTGDIDVIQFNLGQAITEPTSAENYTLQARDMVLVFPHAQNTYNREALYSELKKQTRESAVEPEASLLLKTRYGFVTNEQEQQLDYLLSQVIVEFTNDAKLLPLTQHFTRRELLAPLLTRLNQQARFNEMPKLLSVTGNVKQPGTYPLPVNGRVSDLITAAGGLAHSAFGNRAELTRAVYSETGGDVEAQHIALNLNEVFSGASNLLLQSRDNLNVFETPDWDISRSITLRGEVRFPGEYTIQRNETLHDVIERAGGLTQHAFNRGAIFTRAAVKQKEAEQMKKLLNQLQADIASKSLTGDGTMLSPADANALLKELAEQQPVGRLVIDLNAILSNDPLHNIEVQHGDTLTIPRQSQTISILGEVQHPSSHRYDANLTFSDYLKLAGGPRKRADEERVYIIRADGSVLIPQNNWFAVSGSRLQPGDTIIMPLDTEYKDNITLWAQVTQIFYQSAVALAALNSF